MRGVVASVVATVAGGVGLTAPAPAQAQALKALQVPTEAVAVGEAAFVEVELTPAGGSVWCGLRIDFGNGTTRDIRVGDNDRADLNLRVPVQYASPGDYLVKVSGRMLSRGLRSAAPCEGEARSAVLRVLRGPALATAGAASPPEPGTPPTAAPAPPAVPPALAAPSTDAQLAELRAELARLQDELRQQQAALLRVQAQAAAAAAAPPPATAPPALAPLVEAGQPPSGVWLPPPVGPQSPVPPPAFSGLPPPPSGLATPGPPALGMQPESASGCGPNPTPECAARALVEGISRLRDVLRRRPSQPVAPAGLAAAPPLSPPPLSPLPQGGALPSPAPMPAQPSRQDAGGPPAACTPGRAMEPRDYAQPEFIGRPAGRTARMCFYRGDGRSRSEQLNFYPNGHFVINGVSGSGGFAMAGAVMGTVRGTYGFQDGRLVLRVGYSGTGVTQSGAGAGSQSALDVSATAGRREREVVLPNCQRIAVRQEAKAYQLPAGEGHPAYLVLDGQRWEPMRIDCPAWQGWQTPGGMR